ncbi:MAG: substrate-binding domain-containing protein [Eubacteriales bacterium]
MKKRLLSVLLASAMVMSLVACGSSTETATTTEEPAATEEVVEVEEAVVEEATEEVAEATGDETYHFEIVSKGFQSTYWQAVYVGAVAKIDELNAAAGYDKYSMNMVGPDSESDIAVQVTMFTSALTSNPDAIGLAALDTSALNDAIAQAQSAGIPIIGFDSGVPDAAEGAVYANAATDNYAAGELAGESMYAAVADRFGAGQVRVGVVNQDATAESIINRGLGFIDKMVELATADGYTVAIVGNDKYVSDSVDATAEEADADIIIDVAVPSQTTVELCATEASALLNKSDLTAIYGSNQVAAEGVVTANETLQVLGSTADDIIAVGFDSGTVLKAAVSSGVMYGAVTQAPVSIGSVLIELLAASAAGEAVSDTDTGCAFYTAENIASDEIAPNLYD